MADEKKPSIYHDRGTIGSTKELDEYGVWVKSEPQILDSGSDEMGDDLSLDIPDELPGFSAEFDESTGSGSEDSDFSLPEEDFSLDDLDGLDMTAEPPEIPDELSAAPAEAEDDFSISSEEDALPDFPAPDFPGQDFSELDFPEPDSPAPENPEDTAAAEENPEEQGGDFIDMSLEDLLGEVADELPGEADAEEEPAEKPGKAQDQAGIPSAADLGASADMSTRLLLKIAGELSSIREELSALKQEFSMARGETAADHAESRGFFDDTSADDKIALTGDELDNIINTADFTEETGADATEEEAAPDFSEGDIPAGDVSPEAEPGLPGEGLPLDDTGAADLSPEDLSLEAVDFSLPAAGEEHDEPDFSLDDAGDLLNPDAETVEGISLDDTSPDAFSLDDVVLDDTELGAVDLGDTGLGDTGLGDASLDDTELGAAELGTADLGDAELGTASLGDVSLDDISLDDTSLDAISLDDAPLDDLSAGDSGSDGSGGAVEEISLDDLSFEDISQEESSPEEISLDDSGLEGISLGGEEIAMDDFEEDSLDLSGAVIEEPDLGLAIQENPVEEPADIAVLEDEAVEFSPETAFEAPEETLEELPAELLEEPAIPEVPELDPINTLDTIEDEQEIARAEESAAEIPVAGSGASGGEDLEQIIPEGFLLEDLDEGETGFGGAGLDTLEEGVSLDEIPEDVLPEEEEESPVRDEAVLEPELSGLPGGFKKELKQVLSYMDQLLESLPEEKIEEFAQSEYFDTYKKLFKELGLA